MTIPLSPVSQSGTVTASSIASSDNLQYTPDDMRKTSIDDILCTEHSTTSVTDISLLMSDFHFTPNGQLDLFQDKDLCTPRNDTGNRQIGDIALVLVSDNLSADPIISELHTYCSKDARDSLEEKNYCAIPAQASSTSRPSSIHEHSSAYVATSIEDACDKDGNEIESSEDNCISTIVSKSSFQQENHSSLIYAHEKPLPKLSEPAEPVQSQPNTAEARNSMRGLHALQELMETERAFVKDLRILVKTCLEPLEEISWIPIEHKQLLVRNGQAILEFQTKFLDALEEAYHTEPYAQDKDWYKGDFTAIARCFSQLGKGFSVYTDYCIQHDSAMKLYKEYFSRIEFISFLRKCSSGQNEPRGNSRLQFDDYLIKPVQRICRYQLLLKEINKFTAKGSVENEEVNKAIKTMDEVVGNINNEKEKQDVAAKTELFVSRLEDHWKLNKRFVRPLGSFVISGALEMMYLTEGFKVKYLGCAVFNTYMIIIRPKKLNQYEPKYWFPLRLFELTDLEEGQGNLMYAWMLHYDRHLFEFSATCPQEKQLWMKAVREAIDHSRVQHETRIMNSNDTGGAAEELLVSSLEDSIPSTPKMRSSTSLATLSDSTIHLTDTLLADVSASLKSPIFSPDSNRSSSHSSMHAEPESSSSTSSTRSSNAQIEHSPSSSRFLNRYSHSTLDQVYRRDQRHSHYNQMHAQQLKNTNHSQTVYGHRHTSSIDLKDLFQPTGVKEKMSQLKSSHFHAQRMAVDQKMQDVSTENFLAARAWSVRDRDSFDGGKRRSGIHKTVSMITFHKNHEDMAFDETADEGYISRETTQYPVHPSIGGIVISAVKRKASLPDHRRSQSIYVDARDDSKPKSAGAVEEKHYNYIQRQRSISIKSINNDYRVSRSSNSFIFPSFNSTTQTRKSYSGPESSSTTEVKEPSSPTMSPNGLIGKFVGKISGFGSTAKSRGTEAMEYQKLAERQGGSVETSNMGRPINQAIPPPISANINRRNSVRSSLSSPLKNSYMVEEFSNTSPSEASSAVPRSYSTFSAFNKGIYTESSLPPTPTDYKQQLYSSDKRIAPPPLIMPLTQTEKEKKMHTFRKLKEIASPRLKSGALMLLAKRNNAQAPKTNPKDTDNISFRKAWLKKAPKSDSEISPVAYSAQDGKGTDKHKSSPIIELDNIGGTEAPNSESSPLELPEPGPLQSPLQHSLKGGSGSHDTFVSCNSSSQLSDSNSLNRPLSQTELVLSVDTSRERLYQTGR